MKKIMSIIFLIIMENHFFASEVKDLRTLTPSQNHKIAGDYRDGRLQLTAKQSAVNALHDIARQDFGVDPKNSDQYTSLLEEFVIMETKAQVNRGLLLVLFGGVSLSILSFEIGRRLS